MLRPLDSVSAHRCEIVNEYLLLVLFCHFLYQTDLVPDLEIRYYVGWSIVCIITISILVNFGGVFIITLSKSWHQIKIRRLKYTYKL